MIRNIQKQSSLGWWAGEIGTAFGNFLAANRTITIMLFTFVIGTLLSACVDSNLREDTTTPTPFTPPTGNGQISYILDWNTSGMAVSADRSEWTATTPLGYTVHLKEGSLTSATIQLIDCVELESAFSLVGTAFAGHGDELDPTLITGPFIESLTNPQILEAGTITDLGASYCQGHYVISGQSSSDLPSLTLNGEWHHAATGESGSFDVSTTVAWGDIHALDETINFADGQAVTVTITRELGQLFNSADFATMSDSELSRSILRQLTETVTFSLSNQS